MPDIDLTDPKWNLPLDQLKEAGKGLTIVELEELFTQRLYRPVLDHERYKLNAQMILKLLGVVDPCQLHRRRLAKWLKTNGFFQHKRDRYWFVGLKFRQDDSSGLVLL